MNALEQRLSDLLDTAPKHENVARQWSYKALSGLRALTGSLVACLGWGGVAGVVGVATASPILLSFGVLLSPFCSFFVSHIAEGFLERKSSQSQKQQKTLLDHLEDYKKMGRSLSPEIEKKLNNFLGRPLTVGFWQSIDGAVQEMIIHQMKLDASQSQQNELAAKIERFKRPTDAPKLPNLDTTLVVEPKETVSIEEYSAPTTLPEFDVQMDVSQPRPRVKL